MKTNIFSNESLDLFTWAISKSVYRRCIINENLMLEDNIISIVLMGHIGISVFNLVNYLPKDYLW